MFGNHLVVKDGQLQFLPLFPLIKSASMAPTDPRVDMLLTNILIAYSNMMSAYVADNVFPIVPVGAQSGFIGKFDKESYFHHDVMEKRAPLTESSGTAFGADTSLRYFAEKFSTHIDVSLETLANQMAPFDIERAAGEILDHRGRLKREVDFATDFFKTGVWGTDASASAPWSDYTNGDPFGDVETAKLAIHSNTGEEVSDLVFSRRTLSGLRNNPFFLERVKYTGIGIITVQLLQDLFDIPRIHVGRALKRTSVPGASTVTLDYVYGNHALFLFRPETPSILRPSAGYTFRWANNGMAAQGRRIELEKLDGVRLESTEFFDQKLLGADLGYFLQTVYS